MAAGHSHGVTAAGRNRNRLRWALGLTATYMVAEVIGGLITGSLALLADAAHMLTDVAGLAFALVAIRLADRPATAERTYGLLRAEILSALANAVVLLGLTFYILYEAYQRFINPPEVMGWPLFAVAAVGLAVNLISMKLLAAGSIESLNMRGAYFEVVSDMLGSLGVMLAAVIIVLTGWRLADPLIGAGIGLFIVPRTWGLLKEATSVLLEATPSHVNVPLLEQRLRSIPGVSDIHHLHVWTITSGFDAMCVHLVLARARDDGSILKQARGLAKEEFNLRHTTIQIATTAAAPAADELHV